MKKGETLTNQLAAKVATLRLGELVARARASAMFKPISRPRQAFRALSYKQKMPKFASVGRSRNQYYCGYCDRKFRDSVDARKRHLQSLTHKRARAEHYETFKSAQQRWSEERDKSNCQAFAKKECSFGVACKYSHMTQEERQQLEQQALQEAAAAESATFLNAEATLTCWLEKRRPDLHAMDQLRKRLKQRQSNLALWPPSLRLLFARLQES